jgi:hypothetical protein
MTYLRDKIREELFYAAYGFKPEIWINYELNEDNTFKTFTLKFRWKGKDWILNEVYNGNTNMTDYCTVTSLEDHFKRFVDAELKLVELMKNGS